MLFVVKADKLSRTKAALLKRSGQISRSIYHASASYTLLKIFEIYPGRSDSRHLLLETTYADHHAGARRQCLHPVLELG